MVKVRLYGPLKETLGKGEVNIAAPTVEELINTLREFNSKLRALLERGDFIVLVNDRPLPISQFSTALRDGDTVDIMPVVSGGLKPRRLCS